MKKWFVLILMVCAGAIGNLCQAELSLTSGSLSKLSNADEYAYVEIDWSQATVVEFDGKNRVDKTWGSVDTYNKAQGADWVKDWPEVKRAIVNYTAWEKYPGRACFNKKNKNGVLITVSPQIWKAYQSTKDEDEQDKLKNHCIWVNPATAKYKFVLTVKQVDMGNGVASAFGMKMSTGGAVIVGTLKLIEIKTGKTLATIDVKHCKGIGNYSQRTRLIDVVVGEIFGHVPDLIE
jgi:hypothetical protein